MIKTTKVKNGMVRGISAADPRIISYKGIPFAAPPVGDLRWRAPQPCADWEGTKDCFQFAPISMQSAPGVGEPNIYDKEWNVDPELPMSEDCLYLNIWTPAKTTEEKLPVYIWYYGGALQWGNVTEMEFDGERLARRGIVVVTVAYRLNVFGFLTHPELREEDPETPFNFGNLDQQYAIKWVSENIAAFGGDPDKITIGGQSAGGGSVVKQLNCEENKKYIKGAVIESGVFVDPYKDLFKTSFEMQEQQSKEFFEFLGVKNLEEARALPAEVIRDKNDAFGRFWCTIPDGKFQKTTVWEGIKNHTMLDVPVLAGWTNNEFPTTDGEHAFAATELGSRLLSERRQEAGYKSDHFLYEFGPFMPGEDNPGAFHSSDLWFFFETLAKCWRPFTGIHYDLARQMCNYVADFVKTGDPNGVDADGTQMPKWPVYKRETNQIMGFHETAKLMDTTINPGVEKNLNWMEDDSVDLKARWVSL